MVALFRDAGPQKRYRILDTSVIIDGRIADICETGFMDGTLVIPQFVLKELQLVADSADSLKRNRGRRGLDILEKIAEDVRPRRDDFRHRFPRDPRSRPEFIELGRTLEGKIVTNDFNLNKVAQLAGGRPEHQRARQFAEAVVLPGEFMKEFSPQGRQGINQGGACSMMEPWWASRTRDA